MHRLHDQLKLATIGAVLNYGITAVSFRPSWPGVEVPDSMMADPSGTLTFSPYFSDPTDLTLSELGISQTLTFDNAPYKCFLPWGSIIGFQNEDAGMMATWKPMEPQEIPKKPSLVLVP